MAATRLASYEVNRGSLLEAGIVPALIGHVTAKTTVTPNLLVLNRSREQYREAAAVVLGKLAADKHSAGLVAKAGAIPPLLQLAKPDMPELLQKAGLNTLCTLAIAGRNRPVLIEAGAAAALVKVLAAENKSVWEAAASILTFLTMVPKGQLLVAQAGAIPHLVRMLHGGSALDIPRAAMVLQNLANQGVNKPLLVEAGAVPLMMKLLDSKEQLTQESAAGFMLNLSMENYYHKVLIDAGVVPALLPALRSHLELVQNHATGTALNLSLQQEGRQHLVVLSQALVERSRHSHSRAAQEQATLAVWDLISRTGAPLLAEHLHRQPLFVGQTDYSPCLPSPSFKGLKKRARACRHAPTLCAYYQNFLRQLFNGLRHFLHGLPRQQLSFS